MRVFAVVHVRTSEKTLDLCVPYAPAPGVRNNDQVDQLHDFIELKTRDHGDERSRRHVEEMEFQKCGDACGRHYELSGGVVLEESKHSIRWN